MIRDNRVALKRYGQNFLVDANILGIIISHSCLCESDCVLEIGAGKGVLTRALLESGVKFLHSLEIDERFRPELEEIARENENFAIHWTDAMKFDYGSLRPFPNKIAANIPYNITTPLIWNLLKFANFGLTRHVYMVQREAAERLAAKPDTKARYPLGVALEAMGSVKIVKQVSRKCFRPVPDVDSCIIEINLERNFSLAGDELWREFLHRGFAHRRKFLLNNLEGLRNFSRGDFLRIFSELGIDAKIRAEDLDCESWLKLYEKICAT